MTTFLAIFAFLVCFAFHWGDDYWWSKWAAFQAMMIVGVAYGICRKVHWSAGLTIGWLCLSSLWVFQWRDNVFSSYPPIVGVSFESVAANAAFTALLFGFFFSSIPKKILEIIRMCVATSSTLVSHVVIIQFLAGKRGDDIHGMFSQASMSGVYVALTLPLFFWAAKGTMLQWMSVSCVMAIAILGGPGNASAPVGCLLVLVGSWVFMAWRQSGLRPRYAWHGLALCTLVIGSAIVLNPRFFLSPSRLRMDELALSWWWKNSSVLFGAGHSTLFTYLGHIQALAKEHEVLSTHRWIWLHNDWLQILIETGVVGFVLTGITYVTALTSAWRKQRPDLFSSLCVLGAVAFIQYPAHLPAHAFAAGLVLYLSLERPDIGR